VQILNPSVGFPQLSGSSDNYKTEDWTTIYVSYIDMYKCKRNEALNVVAYKIYYSYYVVQWSLSASSLFEI
jgi:hypothetical protein